MLPAPPTMPPDEAEPTGLFDPRLRGATTAILLIVALSAFEGLAVAAALPQVAASLGDVELLPWVITSYLLTSGVATVAAGSLVDRLGVGPVFRVSVTIFSVGGVLAGLAPTMTLLVLARALQGVGAGAVNAVGLTAVGLVFPRRLVGRAFAANTNVWGAMSVAGPAIAAVLLAFASWRWIFLLNLPLGAIALAAGWHALPDRPDTAEAGTPLRPFDLVLLTACTLFVMVAVDRLDAWSLPALVAALGAGAWVLRRNRGRADALLAPRHAIDAPLGPLGWTVALLLVGAIGTQSFVPLFVSGGRGGSTLLTASSVVFFVLGWTSGANIGSRLLDRVSALGIIRVGTVLTPLGLLGVAVSAALVLPLPLLFACLVAAGAGVGSATNAALTQLRSLVDDHDLGRATAAHQFVRNLGFAMGNALAGAVLLLIVGRLTGDVEQIRAVLGEGGAELASANQGVAEALQTGFASAALLCALVAALSGLPLWWVRRHVEAERTLSTA